MSEWFVSAARDLTRSIVFQVGDTDVSEDSFITTDDFDSVSDFSFYATFRIYFDSASAAGQRRRRLLARDVSVPGNRLRQSTMANTDANAALTVPRDAQPATTAAALPTGGAIPNPVTQTPSSTSEPLLIAAMVIGILALLASCCTIFVLFAVRRRDRKREEEDAFIRQRLVQSFETTKAPVWGTGSSSV